MSKLHPIQLEEILVEELELKIRDIKKAREEDITSEFSLKTGHSNYLKVKLHGVFSVGENFPSEFVNDWAEKNAPLILVPFVRENIYSLASRAKVNTIVPLFTLPSIRKV